MCWGEFLIFLLEQAKDIRYKVICGKRLEVLVFAKCHFIKIRSNCRIAYDNLYHIFLKTSSHHASAPGRWKFRKFFPQLFIIEKFREIKLWQVRIREVAVVVRI